MAFRSFLGMYMKGYESLKTISTKDIPPTPCGPATPPPQGHLPTERYTNAMEMGIKNQK